MDKFEILMEISPSNNNTISSENALMAFKMKKAAERCEEEQKTMIEISVPSNVSAKQTKKPPRFNNQAVNNLYNYGLYIPEEKLNEILSLPRETLIEDLEKMISDAESRYKYFNKMKWEEETHTFLLHSLFLLNEINAIQSLPKIFSFFENGSEFIEFWIGDHITETVWICFYGLGLNQLELIKQFLLKPGIDTYVKSSITRALCQMVLHHPEKRNEILNVFSEVFTEFFQASLKDNLVDSDFLSLAVGDASDCGLIELLPLIKQLYDKDYVSHSICGDYNDVEMEFKHPRKNVIEKIYSISELYRNITSTWSGYLKEKDDGNDSSDVLDFPVVQEYVKRTGPKIGRNDPCPCGSGKKYKKCHGAN